ncbi:hypothetical protein CDSE_0503 [Candidatus Kinetoplastibacterium desouzaii TCC079E]|uniref:Impact N-terminal domain-containing protein n=1 Tax=Candidatus Kinetoplastidibacterium desouzai TCC079E TaxID=1208919 RepID=M1LM71_9PROT|nr:YigZ family protein [Candidatus Kinetoplastibacterium desouzaii]AGF46817.1 hypothetical protein CDSE_0503 [Candidatus Kinetoplastibacterium desouzaii TCC079E]
MRTLKEFCRYEFTIKNSIFISYALHVSNVQEIEEFFDNKTSKTATHNCWAFKIGGLCRFNDDNEPSGTAGKSILQAIELCNIDQVAVLVSRWFGGIKLGAGVLTRVYRTCASNCINSGVFVELIDFIYLKCKLEISFLSLLRDRLKRNELYIYSEKFEGNSVFLMLKVPNEKISLTKKIVNDITRGGVYWYDI